MTLEPEIYDLLRQAVDEMKAQNALIREFINDYQMHWCRLEAACAEASAKLNSITEEIAQNGED